MQLRAKFLVEACAIGLAACDSDDQSVSLPDEGTAKSAKTSDNAVGASGSTGNTMAEVGNAGRAGRRSPLACTPQTDKQVTCGGELCPTSAKHEKDPCFVPCCVTFQGAERCGFRGTSAAFSTECVLPAQSDPSCDEVPQFEGCCEPTQGVCGVIGGFAPGCQTKSRFATLPEHPKACTWNDADAGPSDSDAGPKP